jgi:hypothetical protein
MSKPMAVAITIGSAGQLVANLTGARLIKEAVENRNQLGIIKGLLKQNTARHAISLSMQRAVPGHVDDGHRGPQFPGPSRHVPSVGLSGHPYVSENGADRRETILQSSNGVVRVGNKNGREASISQGLPEKEADDEFIFRDEDDWFPGLIQAGNPSLLATAKLTGRLRRFFNRIARSAANILGQQVAVTNTNAPSLPKELVSWTSLKLHAQFVFTQIIAASEGKAVKALCGLRGGFRCEEDGIERRVGYLLFSRLGMDLPNRLAELLWAHAWLGQLRDSLRHFFHIGHRSSSARSCKIQRRQAVIIKPLRGKQTLVEYRPAVKRPLLYGEWQ